MSTIKIGDVVYVNWFMEERCSKLAIVEDHLVTCDGEVRPNTFIIRYLEPPRVRAPFHVTWLSLAPALYQLANVNCEE